MCKMAHFGNCDPETADQEYCIFHKPNKSEEEAREFYRKFLEKFKPKVEEIDVGGRKIKRLVFEEAVDAAGFVFPEIPDTAIEYIDHEGNEWNQKFSFEYAVFNQFVDMTYCIFESRDNNNMKSQLLNFPISFSNSKFNGGCSFNESIFKGRTSFGNAIFSKRNRANFYRCSFHKEVNFHGTIFRGGSNFQSTYFSSYTNFSDSIHYFSANFKFSIFNGAVNFNNSILYNFNAYRSEFRASVEFIRTKFMGHSNFSYSNFEAHVYFENSEFVELLFNRSKFRDRFIFLQKDIQTDTNKNPAFINKNRLLFDNSVFFGKLCICYETQNADSANKMIIGTLQFNSTVFKEKVHFKNLEIDYANFDLSTFWQYVEFDNVFFKMLSKFAHTQFNKTLFFKKTSFNNVKFEKTLFGEYAYFENCNFKTPKAEIEARRVQRLTYEKEGKRDEADRMFVLEMRARRKIRKSKLSESAVQKATSIWGVRHLLSLQDQLTTWLFKSSNFWKELIKLLVVIVPMVFMVLLVTFSIAIFQFLYMLGYIGEVILGDWISLYGTSWERVFGASLLVIFGSAGGFWIGQKFNLGSVCLQSKVTQAGVVCQYHIHSFKDSLYYSLVTFTTLGYGDMHPTGWLKALSAIEALTGAVFMALIVAVIARKWMR